MKIENSLDTKCAKCKSGKPVELYTMFFLDKDSQGISGACFVPVCKSCIHRKRWIQLGFIWLIAVVVIAGANLIVPQYAEYGSGLGFVIALMSLWTLRSPRQMYAGEIAIEYIKKIIKNKDYFFITDLQNEEEKEGVRQNWDKMLKWIVCPRCLRLVVESPSSCPSCGQNFPLLKPEF